MQIKQNLVKESFNTIISHQIFYYKFTNTNSKGDFVFKKRSEQLVLKISDIQKDLTQIYVV